jgi:serine O-acetyltransferase
MGPAILRRRTPRPRADVQAPAVIREESEMPTPIEYIRSDLFRYTGNASLGAMFREYLANPSFRYSFWWRLCKSNALSIRLLAKLINRIHTRKYLIQIPHCVEVGFGLYIGHHMCVVVSGTAVIGHNCNLSQFVTIGSNHGKAASIGDNVYIGPSVCIVEDVTIGSNATIGAGAVVVKDVPENSTVAGSPAKVVSMKQPARYVQNPWPV